MNKKFHFLYKTTNTITGKFYIGIHSTDDLSDGYLGSGIHLKSSILKHGKENHVLEILEFLPDRKTLSLRESEIVDAELLNDPYCMNLRYGGDGGRMTAAQYKQIANARRGMKFSKETIEKRAKAIRGRKFSEEHRRNLSASLTGITMPESMRKKTAIRVSGAGNPMYGQGQKLSGEKNGMFGNSVNKGKKQFFCVELNKWFQMFPDDERMKTGTWRPGRK